MILVWMCVSLLALSMPVFAQNTMSDSFARAKKLAAQVYAGHATELYCGCAYTGNVVDMASCGYQPRKDAARATRLEWEHVVPAEAFGQSFPEWRVGHPACVDSKGKAFKGRNCARKMARLFRSMEADLYNLYPAIGEMNRLRSNYAMAMIPGETRAFGACDVEIESRKFEPRPAIRGDIGRTYLYMEWAYPGHAVLSPSNRQLFLAWSRDDPVDDWERERARRIEVVQGNRNPFICADASALSSTRLTSASNAKGGVIGNKRTKVYYRAACAWAMKVLPQNQVRFRTDADAHAAGYRLAGNCP